MSGKQALWQAQEAAAYQLNSSNSDEFNLICPNGICHYLETFVPNVWYKKGLSRFNQALCSHSPTLSEQERGENQKGIL